MAINRVFRDDTNEGPGDMDALFAPNAEPSPLPLDDETRKAALLEIMSILGRHGYDAWFQNDGVDITHKVGPRFVRFRIECLGEHIPGEAEPDEDD